MENLKPLDDLKKLEEAILNRELTPEIKYSIDFEMESQVKYDFLKEKYGSSVDDFLESKGMDKKDLGDPSLFGSILESLENNILKK
jgi:hypothetical protein